MFIISGLIPLALLLIVAWICFRTLRRAVTIPAHLLRGERCGKCAYELGGVDTPNCPECGSDLDLVGVITPIMQLNKRPGGIAAALAWTVLAFVLAALFLFVFVTAGGSSLFAQRPNRVEARVVLAPERRGDYYSVLVVSTVSTLRDGSLQDGTVAVVIEGPSGRSTTTVDASTLNTSSGEAFDAAKARDLMRAAGIDVESEPIREESEHLALIVASIRDAPTMRPGHAVTPPGEHWLTSRGRGRSIIQTGFSTGDAIVSAAACFSALLWLAGLVAINHRRQTLYARAAAAEPG